MKMLLALDVGNTHVMAGVLSEGKILTRWRLSTDRSKTEDEYGLFLYELFTISGLDPKDVRGVIMASVVPPLTCILEKLSQRYFNCKPLMIEPGMDIGMPILYDNPHEVGADRLANAVAAYHLYGGPSIVVDFGTATSFDVISALGEYMGGAIAPGILTATEALFLKAARLPRIDLVDPGSAIGKDTVSSMQAGVIYGFAGQVDALVERIRTELGTGALAVATGGLAPLVAAQSRTINKVNLDLTLTGLRLIYERKLHRRSQQRVDGKPR
ncbi:MAG TPA: type III pantothenate kinase [bacterium]|jgi:type III pantothenate kinase|nr:type III pantothenate kinase [bacterium]